MNRSLFYFLFPRVNELLPMTILLASAVALSTYTEFSGTLFWLVVALIACIPVTAMVGRIMRYVSQYNSCKANGLLPELEYVFTHGDVVAGGCVIIGKNYILAKHSGRILYCSEIAGIYENNIHINFSPNRFFICADTKSGVQVQLCSTSNWTPEAERREILNLLDQKIREALDAQAAAYRPNEK